MAYAPKAQGTKKIVAPKPVSRLSAEEVVKIFKGTVALKLPRVTNPITAQTVFHEMKARKIGLE